MRRIARHRDRASVKTTEETDNEIQSCSIEQDNPFPGQVSLLQRGSHGSGAPIERPKSQPARFALPVRQVNERRAFTLVFGSPLQHRIEATPLPWFVTLKAVHVANI
jgi:hypothetical protein